MSAVVVAVISFVLMLLSIGAGLLLRYKLPDSHLSGDSKDVIRLATALIGTMAAVVLVIAFTHYGNLTGTSFDFIHHRAPADVVINKADSISDQFQILEFAGLVIWGIALIGFSVLMARAEDVPSPLAWLTFTVGVVCFAYVRAPILLDVSRVGWSLAMGSYLLLRDPVGVTGPEQTETA